MAAIVSPECPGANATPAAPAMTVAHLDSARRVAMRLVEGN